MSDPFYDFVKDLVVPGLAGIGATVFGLGAVLTAYRANDVADDSLGLAAQVRNDELKREADAASDRYRDQLFRTIEPAVTALLEHRSAALAALGNLRSPEARNAESNAIARLRMAGVVANNADRRIVIASLESMQSAMKMNDSAVLREVLGALAIILPELLVKERDLDLLVREIRGLVDEAVRRTTPED